MKKKNTLLAVVAAAALVLGGAGVAYNQVSASDLDEQTVEAKNETVNQVELSESVPDQALVKGQPVEENPEAQLAERKALEPEDIGQINIPLELDNSNSMSLLSNTETAQTNPIVARTELQASENVYGKSVYVVYKLAQGQEIFISQNEDTLESVDATLEAMKSRYDESTLSLQEINGATALIEDGESRKTVHLITDDLIYTLSSVDADNLDQLLEIANGIQP